MSTTLNLPYPSIVASPTITHVTVANAGAAGINLPNASMVNYPDCTVSLTTSYNMNQPYIDMQNAYNKINDRLHAVEDRLKIYTLSVNTELEKKWNELRELGEQYRKLEQHIQAQEKTWEILNKKY